MSPDQRARALRLADVLDSFYQREVLETASFLRELAAEPVPQGAIRGVLSWDVQMPDDVAKWITAHPPKIERAAEPVRVPVAWMCEDGTLTGNPDRADETWEPLYTHPPYPEVQQAKEIKPVLWIWKWENSNSSSWNVSGIDPAEWRMEGIEVRALYAYVDEVGDADVLNVRTDLPNAPHPVVRLTPDEVNPIIREATRKVWSYAQMATAVEAALLRKMEVE